MVPARFPFGWVPFLAALPLLFHASFPEAAALPENPHAYFQQPAQCPKCHLYAGPNLDPGRFNASSIDFCLECHVEEKEGRTHPVKVHPRAGGRGATIPPEFRLGEGGYILCLTCHTAHGPYLSVQRAYAGQGPANSDGGEGSRYKTFFLRRTDPAGEGFEAMCGACHRVP